MLRDSPGKRVHGLGGELVALHVRRRHRHRAAGANAQYCRERAKVVGYEVMRGILFLGALALACSAEADNGGPGRAPTVSPSSTVEPEPICRGVDEECADSPDSCCSGTACIHDLSMPMYGKCAAQCTQHSTCASGCCTELENAAFRACAPEPYCACVDDGFDCSAPGAKCCGDSVCVRSELTVSISCAARCKGNIDCKSACCAPLDGAPETLVCSPPEFCR